MSNSGKRINTDIEPDKHFEPVLTGPSEPSTSNPSENVDEQPEVVPNDKDIDLEKGEQEPPYTIFTTREIYFMGIFISLSNIWSILSSSLYFPAIPNITKEFNVSTGLSNVAVVVYLIFQGISPLFISGLSDTFGRRPVCLTLLTCYIAVCIGISQVRVYWAILVLRMAQATSIASIISAGFGMVGDLAPRATRGSFAGFVGGVGLSGQAFGGLIGGLLVSRWDWPGVFVFAAIGGGFSLITCFLFVPETNRTLVGNQSIEPKYFYQKTPFLYYPSIRKRLNNDYSTLLPKKQKSSLLNTLKIFVNKLVFVTNLPAGIQFAAFTVCQAALSTILIDKYHYNEIQVGLSYLPSGFGSIIGALVSGRVMNWNYKRRKDQWDALPEPKHSFNIHAVRSEFCTRLTAVFCTSLLVFGWCLSYKVNLAPIYISLFFISFSTVWFVSNIQTVLLDLYPAQASASSSCVNVMRCLLSAAAVAAQQKMMDALTIGGTFTLLAGFSVLSLALFKVTVYLDKKKLGVAT